MLKRVVLGSFIILVTGAVILLFMSRAEQHRRQVKRDLQVICLRYQEFYDENGRAPESAEELVSFSSPFDKQFPSQAGTAREAAAALRKNRYTIYWKIRRGGIGRNQGIVLLFEKQTPQHGGMVCYEDGVTQVLSKDEFAKAPKSMPEGDATGS